MSVILIVTIKEDVHADLVLERLEKHFHHKVYRINTEDFDELIFYSSIDSSIATNTIYFPALEEELDLSNVDLAWFRKVKYGGCGEHQRFIDRQRKVFYEFLWNCIPSEKWINNPSSVFANSNKLSVLEMAKQVGLSIPQTMISNNITRMTDFTDNGGAIVKSLDSASSKIDSDMHFVVNTRMVSSGEIASSSDAIACVPNYLQEFVSPQYELRITLVDEHIFACKMAGVTFSDSCVDIRTKFDEVQYSRYVLPHSIEFKLIQLRNKLNVSYMAVDMIRNAEGTYVFLEANLCGQWLWIEKETGFPITDTLVALMDASAKRIS